VIELKLVLMNFGERYIVRKNPNSNSNLKQFPANFL